MKLDDERAIQKSLERLGRNAHEVAQSLREAGIKGKSIGACSCPIAEYLKAEFQETFVSVGFSSCNVNGVISNLPLAVTEFIEDLVYSEDGWVPERYKDLVISS